MQKDASKNRNNNHKTIQSKYVKKKRAKQIRNIYKIEQAMKKEKKTKKKTKKKNNIKCVH